MTSSFHDEIPLSSLYLQIEYGDSPSTILGLTTVASEAEIREAYRAIALRIHPDKAHSDKLQELHTSLFQKVHDAYQRLQKDEPCHIEENGHSARAPQQLPETLASLHARNLAFKEALKQERAGALSRKEREDELKAKRKAKNERLAAKRELQAQTMQQERMKREKELARREKEKNAANGAPVPRMRAPNPDIEIEDWEQEEDRLQKKAKLQHSPQNRPSARIVAPDLDPDLDYRVSEEDIQPRWDRNVLGGGLSGSISLKQKDQREQSAAAQVQKAQIALSGEAYALLPAFNKQKPWPIVPEVPEMLRKKEELLHEAFVGMEEWADGVTDRTLRLMDKDVVEQFILKAPETLQRKALGTLMITNE